jgi:hypothetical protein
MVSEMNPEMDHARGHNPYKLKKTEYYWGDQVQE